MNQQEFEQAAWAEMAKQQQEQNQRARWHAASMQALREMNHVNYAAIVAVDERGAFSKDGEIPWHYKEDFQWFQQHTKDSICVMGRATYNDIVKRLGDKAEVSVLPNRKCFVVTSTDLPRANATKIGSLSEVQKHLTDEDMSKTVFFIGGERIYREGIALADTLFITIVNRDVEGDRHFPVDYVLKHFNLTKVFSVDAQPDLRFTIWNRIGTQP